ncbi:MAG TPA: ABC transporter ATP-binding protein [Polyangiaceae bacterium]|nr:ABC transporter ATP-binding protein [Polyangiaceae bacterium]
MTEVRAGGLHDAHLETRERGDDVPILEVRHLGKYFSIGGGFRPQRLRALNDVSFKLHPREVIALVGESGSGKSTVAKILARLERPTSGQVLFQGRDILRAEPRRASLAYRSKVQMIFQDPFGSLNPLHRVRYHLARPLVRHHRLAAAGLEERVLALLEAVGLTPPAEFASKLPHQMSGGQRQRVAIARALAVEPAVILADEPISMLDVSIRMGVLNLMLKLKQERDLAFLYITHDIGSARYIGDNIMVMYAGHIVESAPSDQLIDAAAHPYTELLLAAVPDPTSQAPRAIAAKSGAPKLIDPPPGCAFADRCPKVMDVCRRENPEPIAISPRHHVRCHLYR